MLKFFKTAFALSGDRTAVPDAVDANGNVTYAQGYGFDYQRQKTDPAAKQIERDKMNQIFFDVTNALAELQAQGVPDFITSALNGGTAYSYGQNAVVRYSGDLYVSLVAANTALPSDATKWALLPIPSRLQSALNTRATAGGTVDALTATFTPAIAALPAAPNTLSLMVRAGGANTSTTPTFSPDGLTAKTIVKGANQALSAGDIAGAGHWLHLDYDATLDKWVLQNPAFGISSVQVATVQGAFKNLVLSATGLSQLTAITADELVVEAGAGQYQTLRSVNVSPSSGAAGLNGLDTGSVAINTWYSVWVIWNGTTVGSLLSLSATAPTMPGGYTHKARVGWIRTDGSGSRMPLSFRQFGREVQYTPAAGSNLTAYPSMASGSTAGVVTAIALATFSPPTAAQIKGGVTSGSGANAVVTISPNNAAAVFDFTTGTSNGYGRTPFLFLIEGANIYWSSTHASCNVTAVGWTDTI